MLILCFHHYPRLHYSLRTKVLWYWFGFGFGLCSGNRFLCGMSNGSYSYKLYPILLLIVLVMLIIHLLIIPLYIYNLLSHYYYHYSRGSLLPPIPYLLSSVSYLISPISYLISHIWGVMFIITFILIFILTLFIILVHLLYTLTNLPPPHVLNSNLPGSLFRMLMLMINRVSHTPLKHKRWLWLWLKPISYN